MFEGKLFCKECGNKLTVSYRRNHDYWTVNCNKYSRDPLRVRCTSHFFPYNYLEEQLIEKEQIESLSTSESRVVELIQKMARGNVTPMTLLPLADDFLSA